MKCPQIIGVTVSDTSIDATIAKARVRENSLNIRPITPGMKSNGMKAAMRDRLIDTTVKPI